MILSAGILSLLVLVDAGVLASVVPKQGVTVVPYGKAMHVPVSRTALNVAAIKKTNFGALAKKRVQALTARGVAVYKAKHGKRSTQTAPPQNDPATNTFSSYYITATVGNNTVKLILDSGSSVLWIGPQSGNPYTVSSTSTSTGQTCSQNYGSGSMSGKFYYDTVTIRGTYLAAKNTGVCAATSVSGVSEDGIFGIGPSSLTYHAASGTTYYPTPSDNLKSQGVTSVNVVSVYFKPLSSIYIETSGQVTFGNVDPSRYTGSITYIPISNNALAGLYWGIDATAWTIGGTSIMNGATKISGIIDTGTTLLLMTQNIYNAYVANIPNAAYDSSSGLLRWPTASQASVGPLNITIAGTVFSLTPSQQILPADLVNAFGYDSSYYYSYIGNAGAKNSDGTGLDFLLGQKFLEHFYSIFDSTNKRIGLATAV